tara:strand:- start:1449 stop:3773 length:2325 start_codon:yes stop_codon:yes gene_type:complete
MDIIPKVFAHTSYVGTGGYNNHSRDFFRHLSKLIDVKVRNFTTTPNWLGVVDEPHNNEEYINNTDKKLLDIQNLWKDSSLGIMSDHKIYSKYKNEFKHNVNLILSETNHHYYYQNYVGPKIGYNVWESTLQPEGFFNKWKEFDQLWVPSKWQAQCTINQGIDPNKVKVVPEGVDTTTFYPDDINHEEYDDGRFKFILFGRWDYRKSTKEIIETFLKTFLPDEPIDLILSIDNMFGERIDGFTTTEKRLKYWNLQDNRLKIKHFPSREDYIKYIKKGHVFLSCSRSEGWNLPLIEAMACGTPSIYSNCSAQLEFAEGKGLPVNIIGEKPAACEKDTNWKMAVTTAEMPGNYYEPDFDDLSKVMRDAYKNYDKHKTKALKDAKIIHKDFNWDKVAEIGKDTLVDFMKNYKEPKDENEIIVTYNNGPKVEIIGDVNKEYFVEFIDKSCNCVIHKDTIKNNMWTACGRKYYTEWIIKINGEIIDKLNLEGKEVFIDFKSGSIGDNIAWIPYVEEFRKKHNCKIICYTFFNDWFKEQYPKIEFGRNDKTYVKYDIGWFYNGDRWDTSLNPNDFKFHPLQKTASDILGLEFKEIKSPININDYKPNIKGKYVTLSIQSTSQCKYWNHPTGWQQVVEYLNSEGYKVVLVDQFTQFGSNNCMNIAPKNIINKSNLKLSDVTSVINKAEFHIGISSGLSWLAWAVNTPVVLVSSFTKPYCEFTTNCIRIYNDTPTSGYFNTHRLDPLDWNWYPFKDLKNMEDWYEVENITPEQVINKIKTIIK